MKEEITYDSLDALKDYLKILYQTNGIDVVKEWVKNNLKRGTILSFKTGPSGISGETIEICDRRLELLDKNGINVTDNNFLPLITNSIDLSICTIYISQRVLFIEEPFGLVIYKKVS